MRLFTIAVVVAALLAAIGSTFLHERPDWAASALNGVLAMAPGAIASERGGEPVEPTTDLASLLATSSKRSAAPAKSVVYQWVDERGSVNFAASLDEVPVAWRQRAGQIEFDAGAFAQAKGSSPRTTPSRRAQPVPDTAPIPVREVTVYTAPWCGWCRKTLAFLDERGVDYVNKDIEADEDYAAELREKTGGSAVPLVEIDGSQIHGFDPGEMAALLD